MLNFLPSTNKDKIVGIAVTPGIGLEVVVLNSAKRIIESYGRRELDYNFPGRNIKDYGQFKIAMKELMDELKIPQKSLCYVVLPNVYFDFIYMPASSPIDEVKTAIVSKAEDNYTFQKQGSDPISGWCEVINDGGAEMKKYAFSSFRRNDVDSLKISINELGLKLAGLETSYSASLRGLYCAGLVDDVVEEQAPWTVMLVNTNSFTLFQMQGGAFVDYSDVPLAIKSFSPKEAYQAIVSNATQLLQNYTTSRLYIISQTDEISSEVLKKQLNIGVDTVAIDSNKYSKAPLLEVMSTSDFNVANSLTVTSLGAANPRSAFKFVLNSLQDDPDAGFGAYFSTHMFGKQIEITSSLVQQTCFTLAFIFAVIFGAIGGISILADNGFKEKISNADSQIQALNRQIDEMQKVDEKQEVDMTALIDYVEKNNISALTLYDSISSDIPKNIWLTKYYSKDGNRIAIQGIAQNIVDVYEYYKNLKVASPQTDIKLTELKVITENTNIPEKRYLSGGFSETPGGERLYSFEISNTSIQQVQPIGSQNVNETDIIIRPSGGGQNEQTDSQAQQMIDQTSKQMKPAG